MCTLYDALRQAREHELAQSCKTLALLISSTANWLQHTLLCISHLCKSCPLYWHLRCSLLVLLHAAYKLISWLYATGSCCVCGLQPPADYLLSQLDSCCPQLTELRMPDVELNGTGTVSRCCVKVQPASDAAGGMCKSLLQDC